MTEVPDLEALVRGSLSGDNMAHAQLLREVARLLRPFLARRLVVEGEVDDLLQEILLSVHKARHTYDGNRPCKPWLFAIAKFRLNDYLRLHHADQPPQAVDVSELEEILPEGVTEPELTYESISREIQRLVAGTIVAQVVGNMRTAGSWAARIKGIPRPAQRLAKAILVLAIPSIGCTGWYALQAAGSASPIELFVLVASYPAALVVLALVALKLARSAKGSH